MNAQDKIAKAQSILSGDCEEGVKVIKSDNSLIERTISSKRIVTEDNRELLRG